MSKVVDKYNKQALPEWRVTSKQRTLFASLSKCPSAVFDLLSGHYGRFKLADAGPNRVGLLMPIVLKTSFAAFD